MRATCPPVRGQAGRLKSLRGTSIRSAAWEDPKDENDQLFLLSQEQNPPFPDSQPMDPLVPAPQLTYVPLSCSREVLHSRDNPVSGSAIQSPKVLSSSGCPLSAPTHASSKRLLRISWWE